MHLPSFQDIFFEKKHIIFMEDDEKNRKSTSVMITSKHSKIDYSKYFPKFYCKLIKKDPKIVENA